MINVLFVCLGNICRSPMAEGIFTHLVHNRGWKDRFRIDSAGTSNYHIGERPHPQGRQTMEQHGITLSGRSRQFVPADFAGFQYILGMDQSNYQNILRVAGSAGHEDQVWMMRAFEEAEPAAHTCTLNVPDPYYGEGGFDEVYEILKRTGQHLLDYIAAREGWAD